MTMAMALRDSWSLMLRFFIGRFAIGGLALQVVKVDSKGAVDPFIANKRVLNILNSILMHVKYLKIKGS
jgi:hypothetical protein